ncbi:MAG: lipoate--protein ligase family protein [Planctomycetes bacterium]|nr:lipoate--protein ligase family protein [Planctomycetota bacterium]
MDIRLIIDEPARGSWNMAVDETLLLGAGQGGGAALRFYQWAEPTLSLGYFQKIAARSEHPPSSELPVIRRATGGGAIIHHHELTYSFVTPIRDRFSPEVQDCVMQFHLSLIATLAEDGIKARLCGDAAAEEQSDNFLCFQRRNSLDLLIGDSKFVGSAQRRHQGALLQHGSILLSRSPLAEALPGLEDLAGVTLNVRALIQRWSAHLSGEFGFDLVTSTLLETESSFALEIERARFADENWTYKR